MSRKLEMQVDDKFVDRHCSVSRIYLPRMSMRIRENQLTILASFLTLCSMLGTATAIAKTLRPVVIL